MPKFILIFSALSGMLATGLGAFGAHALKARLEASGFWQTYHTAVNYQFYHTLALIGIALLMVRYPSNVLVYASFAMMVGIILFSGSLYLLCFSGIRWLGAITPFGGLGFILGWVLLLVACLKTEF